MNQVISSWVFFRHALALALGAVSVGCVSGSDLTPPPGGPMGGAGGSSGQGTGGISTGGSAMGGATGGSTTGGVAMGGASGGAPAGGTSATGGLGVTGGGPAITCETGQVPCSGVCVVLGTDQNCSGCGIACPTGSACGENTNGVKACLCEDTTQTACPTGCKDTQNDLANCGACGNSCGLQGSCQEGACTCGVGTASCGGVGCVDILSSPAHCGTECLECGENETCVEGACTCPAPFEACTSGCSDTMTDAANCGGCEAPCDPGQGCKDGACILTPCDPPETITAGKAAGTTDAVCWRILAGSINYNCSNFTGGRTLEVNGEPVDTAVVCGGAQATAFEDGYIYFAISAGEPSYVSISTWR